MSTTRVKELAFESGFDLCGVAPPDVIPGARERFSWWLDNTYCGGMGYLASEPERRSDPASLLASVRSIIVLGLNYYQSNSVSVPEGHGRVSRYARGKDYHDVMSGKIKELIRRLKQSVDSLSGPDFKWYVDSGPVLEKAYAQQAGLGSLGKNSLLINPKYGSWIFLGVILTSLELAPDDPDVVDHGLCEDCNLCVEACPTGAIVADGVIDAARCLSYLTIEHRGEIRAELSRRIGSHIFGCDICQEVCPHNSLALPTCHAELQPEAGVGEFLDARRVLSLTKREEFLKLVDGTPLARRKLEGLQRNARIVLANQQHQDRQK